MRRLLISILLTLFSLPSWAVIQVVTDNTTVQNATPDDQYTGTDDVHIKENAPTTNQNALTFFEINKYDASDHSHTLLRADLSNLPGGSTITSATIYVYLTFGDDGSGPTSQTFSAHPLLEDWVEGEATWSIYSTGNSWSTAGGLGEDTDRDTDVSGTGSMGNTTGTYYAIDVTDFVQDVVDGTTTNYGVHVERTDAANDEAFRGYISSEGTDGQRPEWVIDYTAGGGGSNIPAIYQRLRNQKR